MALGGKAELPCDPEVPSMVAELPLASESKLCVPLVKLYRTCPPSTPAESWEGFDVYPGQLCAGRGFATVSGNLHGSHRRHGSKTYQGLGRAVIIEHREQNL